MGVDAHSDEAFLVADALENEEERSGNVVFVLALLATEAGWLTSLTLGGYWLASLS